MTLQIILISFIISLLSFFIGVIIGVIISNIRKAEAEYEKKDIETKKIKGEKDG